MRPSAAIATAALAALLPLAAACGEHVDKRDRRSHGGGGADATGQTRAELVVSGTLEQDLATNTRVHVLRTRYAYPEGIQLAAPPAVRLSLTDAAGTLLWEKLQVGAEVETEIAIDGAEGGYVVAAEPLPLETADQVEPASPWSAAFDLDVTQPRLVVQARLGVATETGERPLALRVLVAGEKRATCDDASLRLPAPAQPLAIALAPAAAAGLADGDVLLGADGFKVPSFSGTLAVAVRCRDAAGNLSELVEPVQIESRGYTLAAVARGGKSGAYLYVKPGTLDVDLSLLDQSTAEPLAPAALESEKPTLRLFVTEKAPADLADLAEGKPVLWAQPFEGSMSFRLPGQYEGAQTVHVTLVRRDLFAGSENLAGTVALPLFVDGDAPELSLDAKPQLVQPAKDAPLTVSARLVAAGAPVKGVLALEGSVDGKTWTAIASTQTTADDAAGGGAKRVTVSFAYPHEDEQPFRVRLKAVDFAGNAVVSQAGAQLVGRAGLGADLAVAPAQRAACVIGTAPAALLRPWLATSTLCRKRGLDGQLTATQHVTIAVQNRGGAAPVFYQTPAQPPRLAYQVLHDGQIVNGQIVPHAPFMLAPNGSVRLISFPLDAAWLAKDKVEILLDAEPNGPNSTTNGCYPAQAPYASVVVQDKGTGLMLKPSPFACDEDETLR